jgi:hypothetical protein
MHLSFFSNLLVCILFIIIFFYNLIRRRSSTGSSQIPSSLFFFLIFHLFIIISLCITFTLPSSTRNFIRLRATFNPLVRMPVSISTSLGLLTFQWQSISSQPPMHYHFAFFLFICLVIFMLQKYNMCLHWDLLIFVRNVNSNRCTCFVQSECCFCIVELFILDLCLSII